MNVSTFHMSLVDSLLKGAVLQRFDGFAFVNLNKLLNTQWSSQSFEVLWNPYDIPHKMMHDTSKRQYIQHVFDKLFSDFDPQNRGSQSKNNLSNTKIQQRIDKYLS